tara:strand:- start:4 stop:525 length:522 start_codon:yes stop_codon:yes gene_type:complete
MIEILKNSKTQSYIKFKEDILGTHFPWYHNQNVAIQEFNSKDVFYFGHTFFTRPEVNGYSQPASEYFQLGFKVMWEILSENGYDSKKCMLLRMNANCTFPSNFGEFSSSHIDHNFSHLNFLLYLTNSGGSTFVEGEENKPEEDQAILFSGNHFIQLPKKDRRIVLIATIMFMG